MKQVFIMANVFWTYIAPQGDIVNLTNMRLTYGTKPELDLLFLLLSELKQIKSKVLVSPR